jgi:hypothetical protein
MNRTICTSRLSIEIKEKNLLELRTENISFAFFLSLECDSNEGW